MYTHITQSIARVIGSTIPTTVIKQVILPYVTRLWEPGMYCLYDVKIAYIIKVHRTTDVEGVFLCQQELKGERKKHECRLSHRKRWTASSEQLFSFEASFKSPVYVTLDDNRIPYLSKTIEGGKNLFIGWLYPHSRHQQRWQCISRLGVIPDVLMDRNVPSNVLSKECKLIGAGAIYFATVVQHLLRLIPHCMPRFFLESLDEWLAAWPDNLVIDMFYTDLMALIYAYQL